MNKGPQDTVVDLPAQQGGQNGTDAPEYPAAAAPASLLVFVSHIVHLQ